MSTVKKLLPIIKLTLLVGLYLYIALSSALFLYLQLRFFDPMYFPKVILLILAVNTVFLLNLFLSAKPILLPPPSPSDGRAAFVCSVMGSLMFLWLLLHTRTVYDLFFFLCTLVILLLSLSELRRHQP